MSSKKSARGQFTRHFSDNAKLGPEERRRILAEQITSEPGKCALERVSRAGERYEARRVKTEITDTRERRLIDAEREALRKRAPSPAPTPRSMQGASSRAVPPSADELAELRENLRASADVQDAADGRKIHRARCELENKRLASVVDAEQREARRSQAASRSSRQPARRTARSTAFRENKRDMGLGD